jgi:octopine/nopaline transport system permease protein
MDPAFMADTFLTLVKGVPLTLELALLSIAFGTVIALLLALMRLSGTGAFDWAARAYVFVFRGSPLLVQIFLIYYGLGQFVWIRSGPLWTFLRDPFWCAVLALTLNTAAYASEIIRGGLLSVPSGQIEAARACGMSRFLLLRRIVLPIAIRQALPAYGNEIILMIKATSLASIVTLMEVTGLAAKIVSDTYRAVEVFIVAGLIYLAINFVMTRILQVVDHRLTPHMRPEERRMVLPITEGIPG